MQHILFTIVGLAAIGAVFYFVFWRNWQKRKAADKANSPQPPVK
jgi:preprotein translocase subunit YajC